MCMARSSIVTARKRKLRELYYTATERDASPTNNSAESSAPLATPTEIQFLQETDISKYAPTTNTSILGTIGSRLRAPAVTCKC